MAYDPERLEVSKEAEYRGKSGYISAVKKPNSEKINVKHEQREAGIASTGFRAANNYATTQNDYFKR